MKGIFLAILYCFLNSEVQEAVKRQVQRNSTRNDIFRERADSFKYRLNRRRDTCGDNQVGYAKVVGSIPSVSKDTRIIPVPDIYILVQVVYDLARM